MTLRLNGSTSGYTEIDAPAVAGNNSIALPTGNGSAYQILRNGATAGSLEYTDKLVSGTAVASTSGTSIDFTGIPSWAKRVTVMFNGVSTSGTSVIQVQIGSGSLLTSGYNTGVSQLGNPPVSTSYTSGFGISFNNAASYGFFGVFTINLLGSNIWVFSGQTVLGIGLTHAYSNGYQTLSGTLDRVRITTVNGTDTFDAGSINILYE
jgi:hypothetical protein